MEKNPLSRIAERLSSKQTPAEERGFSLRTAEGVQAVANLARLATREVTLEQLNDDRYGINADGSLRLRIDIETFNLLSGTSR